MRTIIRIISNLKTVVERPDAKKQSIPDADTGNNHRTQFEPKKADFEEIVGEDNWQRYWSNCEELIASMRDYQELSNEIRRKIAAKIMPKNEGPQSQTSREEARGVANESVSTNTEEKVSAVVKGRLIPLLESGALDDEQLKQLTTAGYSKSVFKLNFPLLKVITNEKDASAHSKDEKGRGRYYITPITVRKRFYLVTSQWYAEHKAPLEEWLDKMAASEVKSPRSATCEEPSISIKDFATQQLIGRERFLRQYSKQLEELHNDKSFMEYIAGLRTELGDPRFCNLPKASEKLQSSFYEKDVNFHYPAVEDIVRQVRAYGKQASAHISIYYAMFVLDAEKGRQAR